MVLPNVLFLMSESKSCMEFGVRGRPVQRPYPRNVRTENRYLMTESFLSACLLVIEKKSQVLCHFLILHILRSCFYFFPSVIKMFIRLLDEIFSLKIQQAFYTTSWEFISNHCNSNHKTHNYEISTINAVFKASFVFYQGERATPIFSISQIRVSDSSVQVFLF